MKYTRGRDRRAANQKWHTWFAWRPIKLSDGTRIWWEEVKRKDAGYTFTCWEYEEIPDRTVEEQLVIDNLLKEIYNELNDYRYTLKGILDTRSGFYHLGADTTTEEHLRIILKKIRENLSHYKDALTWAKRTARSSPTLPKEVPLTGYETGYDEFHLTSV